jgi:hypothetical protein
MISAPSWATGAHTGRSASVAQIPLLLQHGLVMTISVNQAGDGDAQVALNGGGGSCGTPLSQGLDSTLNQLAKPHHLGPKSNELIEALSCLLPAPCAHEVANRFAGAFAQFTARSSRCERDRVARAVHGSRSPFFILPVNHPEDVCREDSGDAPGDTESHASRIDQHTIPVDERWRMFAFQLLEVQVQLITNQSSIGDSQHSRIGLASAENHAAAQAGVCQHKLCRLVFGSASCVRRSPPYCEQTPLIGQALLDVIPLAKQRRLRHPILQAGVVPVEPEHADPTVAMPELDDLYSMNRFLQCPRALPVGPDLSRLHTNIERQRRGPWCGFRSSS